MNPKSKNVTRTTPEFTRFSVDLMTSKDNESNDARPDDLAQDETDESAAIALPAGVAGSGTLDRLVDTARDYARAATSDNTLKAYSTDWAHFTRWCRMKGTAPPAPRVRIDRAVSGGPCRRYAPALCQHDRPPSVRAGLELRTARLHPRPQEPAHRHGAGRDQAQARPPASAERGDPGPGDPGHGRHPAPGPARITGSRHPSAGLRWGPLPLGDRQP